jgi:hypothetical protein
MKPADRWQDSLYWWSDAIYTRQHKQNKRRQASLPRVGFAPTTTVFEREKTFCALDRTAALTCCLILCWWLNVGKLDAYFVGRTISIGKSKNVFGIFTSGDYFFVSYLGVSRSVIVGLCSIIMLWIYEINWTD